MKKILTTLFFLGLTTVGFSQKYTVAGSAELILNDEYNTLIKCDGDSGVCASITVIVDGWISRLEVPDCNIDKIVIKPFVNGVYAGDLSGETPGNGELFSIKYDPYIE